jgi:hypothetical protein
MVRQLAGVLATARRTEIMRSERTLFGYVEVRPYAVAASLDELTPGSRCAGAGVERPGAPVLGGGWAFGRRGQADVLFVCC